MFENTLISIVKSLLSSKLLMSIVLFFLFCIFAYTALAHITYVLSPWSSEQKVRKRILALTPLGSSKKSVISTIQQQHWRIHLNKPLHVSETSKHVFPGVDGNSVVGVYFGEHYGFPVKYTADAYWGFDENEKMIDLRVRVSPLGL